MRERKTGMTRAGLLGVLLFMFGIAGAGAHKRRVPEKRITETGRIVTLYALILSSRISANVEVCAGDRDPRGAIALPSFFALRFQDGSSILPSPSLTRRPALNITPLKAKQCARGWLDFAVTPNKKPTAVEYHERSADKKPIEWPVR